MKNSCRFFTYFKIEIWNQRTLCWLPQKKHYKTKDEARAARPVSIPSRIRKFTMLGQSLVNGEDT
jgi:hypothetical protein